MNFLNKIIVTTTLTLACSLSWGEARDDLQKALDNLQKINTQNLTQNDQMLFEIAVDKVKLTLSDLQSRNANQDLVKELQSSQGLVGSMIAAPGDVFTRGPRLKSSAKIQVDVVACRVLKRVFGMDVAVGGFVSFNNADEVAAKYNSLRAEYMSLLGQAIAALGDSGRPVIGSSLTWARGMYILSQPDCISIAGWDYKGQCM